MKILTTYGSLCNLKSQLWSLLIQENICSNFDGPQNIFPKLSSQKNINLYLYSPWCNLPYKSSPPTQNYVYDILTAAAASS